MAKRVPEDLGELKAPRTATRAAQPQVTSNEISARAAARLRKVPVYKLIPHDLQPTERHADENVSDLADSIASLGLQEPPLVRSTGRGRYVILAGHRRARAWQLLASRDQVGDKIQAFVLTGLADGDDIAIIAAEYTHRRDFSPLHAARVVGAAVEYRRQELGREPTVREMVDLVPWSRSQINKYRRVCQALEDPRLAPLVHRVDSPTISMLDKILGMEDSLRLEAALEAYGTKGPAAARKFFRKKGPPKESFQLNDQKGGYDLLIRYREAMTPDAARTALVELRKAEEKLRAIVEGAEVNGDGAAP